MNINVVFLYFNFTICSIVVRILLCKYTITLSTFIYMEAWKQNIKK